MEVAGNILHFQVIFFIRIESQYRINERLMFSLVGFSLVRLKDLVTGWFRKMFSFLEEGRGPYFFVFLSRVKRFKLNDS